MVEATSRVHVEEKVADAAVAETEIGGRRAAFFSEIEWTEPTIGLSPDVIRAAALMGWDKPTRVQIAGLALLAKGRNLPMGPPGSSEGAHVLIQAATGCGKTTCFCIASLCALRDGVPGPQVVVVVPTRPLAEEVHRVLSKLAEEVTFNGKKGVPVAAAYGGMKDAYVTAPIVVGCIGTLVRWSDVRRGAFCPLDNVQLFIIDEADEVVGGKRAELLLLKRRMLPSVQIGMFSATFACLDKPASEPARFINTIAGRQGEDATRGMHVPIKVLTNMSLEHTTVFYHQLPGDGDVQEKKRRFIHILLAFLGERALVFCNSADCSRHSQDLEKELKVEFDTPDGITRPAIYSGRLVGGMTEEVIKRTQEDFKTGVTNVMISTKTVGARGLNFPSLKLVVEYDLPADNFNGVNSDAFHHQVGRVGRLGCLGAAIVLVAGAEELRNMQTLEAKLKKKFLPLVPADATGGAVFAAATAAIKAAFERKL